MNSLIFLVDLKYVIISYNFNYLAIYKMERRNPHEEVKNKGEYFEVEYDATSSEDEDSDEDEEHEVDGKTLMHRIKLQNDLKIR